MHILFSFSDNRIVWGHVQNNSALTFHLDRGIPLNNTVIYTSPERPCALSLWYFVINSSQSVGVVMVCNSLAWSYHLILNNEGRGSDKNCNKIFSTTT